MQGLQCIWLRPYSPTLPLPLPLPLPPPAPQYYPPLPPHRDVEVAVNKLWNQPLPPLWGVAVVVAVVAAVVAGVAVVAVVVVVVPVPVPLRVRVRAVMPLGGAGSMHGAQPCTRQGRDFGLVGVLMASSG